MPSEAGNQETNRFEQGVPPLVETLVTFGHSPPLALGQMQADHDPTASK